MKAHLPDLYSAKTSTTSAEASKIQAKAGYFPQIKATYAGSGNYEKYKNSVSSSANPLYAVTSSSITATTNTHTGTISLSQNIFDLGIREATVSAARNNVRAAKLNETSTLHSSMLAVISAYYALLADIDQVKVAKEQLKRYQDTVNLTQAQIDAGAAAKNDIFQAKSNLASAQITLSSAENAVLIASSELKSTIGVDTDDAVIPVPITTGVSTIPVEPAIVTSPTLKDCLKTAYAHRPDFLA